MTAAETWTRVSLPHATFAYGTRDGRVFEAAPIAKWAIGKPAGQVTEFYGRKGAEIRDLPGGQTEPSAGRADVDVHQHDWRDTGKLEKTCDGCSTIAYRVRQPDGRWQTAWRPTLTEQTRQRLQNAGISKDDPGLHRIRAHNAALGIQPAQPKENTMARTDPPQQTTIWSQQAEAERTHQITAGNTGRHWLESQAGKPDLGPFDSEISAEEALSGLGLEAGQWRVVEAEAEPELAGLTRAEQQRQADQQLARELDRDLPGWSSGAAQAAYEAEADRGYELELG